MDCVNPEQLRKKVVWNHTAPVRYYDRDKMIKLQRHVYC